MPASSPLYTVIAVLIIVGAIIYARVSTARAQRRLRQTKIEWVDSQFRSSDEDTQVHAYITLPAMVQGSQQDRELTQLLLDEAFAPREQTARVRAAADRAKLEVDFLLG